MTEMIEKCMSLSEQLDLIRTCIQSKTPLSKALQEKGYNYDNLRYCSYENDKSGDRSIVAQRIEDQPIFSDNIPAVSFFSGAGGLDIGFAMAGFKTVAAIEFERLFCDTLRKNDSEKIVIGPPDYSGDVGHHEEIATILKNKVGISRGFEGVFHGGPPCQPFSIASNQRFNKSGDNFKRKGFEDAEKGNLLFDYLWYIREFMPRGFLIENVGGLLELDDDGRVSNALNELKAMGYSISEPQVINAAFYGVPQNRNRCIILGVRGSVVPVLPLADNVPTPCWSVFERSLDGVKNHITREHNAESIERYMKLEYGCRDQLGRVDRLDPMLPSKTVIAGGTKGGGRSHLHPYYPRTLSVRECARLQTFPDSYEFVGSVARQFTQVGNAVPPLLAYKLALSLKEALKNNE